MYQPVPLHTDPVPPSTNQHRLLVTQYHQVPTSTPLYWPSTIIYQPLPPYTAPVPPSTNQYRPTLTQYHQEPTSTALYSSSSIMYQPVSPYTDQVPPTTNQNRSILTQYHQVLTSTAFYWPIPSYVVYFTQSKVTIKRSNTFWKKSFSPILFPNSTVTISFDDPGWAQLYISLVSLYILNAINWMILNTVNNETHHQSGFQTNKVL